MISKNWGKKQIPLTEDYVDVSYREAHTVMVIYTRRVHSSQAGEVHREGIKAVQAYLLDAIADTPNNITVEIK